MRYLHAIAMHERLIASGVYIAKQGETVLGIVESWSIHQHPDGAQLIRIDHDDPNRQGVFDLVEAWISPQKQLERLDISRHPYQSNTGKTRITYAIHPTRVDIGYTLNNALRQYAELPLNHAIVGIGGYFLLEGLAVAQAIQTPGMMLVPDVRTDHVSLDFVQTAPQLIADQDKTLNPHGRVYAVDCYTDKAATPPKTLCLTQQGILFSYQTDTLRVDLSEYAYQL